MSSPAKKIIAEKFSKATTLNTVFELFFLATNLPLASKQSVKHVFMCGAVSSINLLVQGGDRHKLLNEFKDYSAAAMKAHKNHE